MAAIASPPTNGILRQTPPNSQGSEAIIASNTGKFKDRNSDMTAAGKLISMEGETTRDCMNIPRVQTPPLVKKFRNTTRPEPQVRRVFYGKAEDPDIASTVSHGVITTGSLKAGEVVNPNPKTLFTQRLSDKKESQYASKQKAPLGSSHDQRPGLPKDLNTLEKTFGTPNIFDCSAGELVSPAKTYQQVYVESEEGRELYRKTHHNFHVGEPVDREYDWSQYSKDGLFGIPTPHENNGKNVAQTLKWLRNDHLDKGTKVVSKRVDDFRERTQPQLGMVHDPIKETMTVPADHSYGVLLKPDEYGAGDLIHGRYPGSYLRGKDRERGLVAAIRQQLKKANYHNFNNLQAAFNHYDKNGDGKIDINELRLCCDQFSLPIEPELLEQLILYCDANTNGCIDYFEFANFLNWKDKMNEGETLTNPASAAVKGESQESKEGTPERLKKQIDQAIGGHRTSAQMINAVVGGVSTKGYRTYGVPTVRSDIAAPRTKRISDTKNYGDESDAFGLINPSMYSNKGIYEKDFFQPREPEQIKGIFSDIGVEMDPETFHKLWSVATSRSDQGQVSVESFRNVLDEVQALQLADEAQNLGRPELV
ncbi:EF-hand domain-containing family member B [Strongylocentrotus purpuratus]|uniref:EF-hand domain-containing protein n=1 Tax=Strongylocentrotus purpuratus TaxID=7668 RepID=A0A7M7RFU1_STRPU|nr:EF-hand domain-containing family member B [Strongylocentrotus purpuratus]8SNB_3J Chain 3J, CFAP21 [Strongylocentrotus purpuratus]8SNB_3K Chain 3K, CFAP21 [Strongylocentrotus purpuratus]